MTKFDTLSLKIPAFLCGELTSAEQAEIEAFADSNPAFAADIAFQRTLSQSLKDEAKPSTGQEFGWARLSKAIDTEESRKTDPVVAANDRAPARRWKYAVALLTCVVIGQSIFMNNSDAENHATYQMAGNGEAGFAMDVQISDLATGLALTDFLTDHGGVVTVSTNKGHQYEIVFVNRDSCETARASLSDNKSLFKTYSKCGKR